MRRSAPIRLCACCCNACRTRSANRPTVARLPTASTSASNSTRHSPARQSRRRRLRDSRKRFITIPLSHLWERGWGRGHALSAPTRSPSHEARYSRTLRQYSPRIALSPTPLKELLANRLSDTAAKSLVIPQAGEGNSGAWNYSVLAEQIAAIHLVRHVADVVGDAVGDDNIGLLLE